jgi:4a-hydroxytetrahydrobiopterin dehydratase
MKSNWKEENNFLTSTFTFSDFKKALSFVNKVAEIAEKLNHHPDICIRDYKNVIIATTTHSDGKKITEKDRNLSREIDNMFEV